MAVAPKAILNITGLPNDEFIEEVTDIKLIKKNEIFFAVLIDGLPGDPGFGVGVSELVGALNDKRLKNDLNKKAESTLLDLVEGIEYKGITVERLPEEQFIGADLHFTEVESTEELLIPLAFGGQ